MKRVAIVGGGPAGLMAATHLIGSGAEVHVFEQKKTVGRKFLVAGEGGFNLTHSEDLNIFLERYDSQWIKDCVASYTNDDFRAFLKEMNVPTFIGTSGKVFPLETIKPRDVLNNWKAHFRANGVKFHVGYKLLDWSEGELTFKFDSENIVFQADYVVFALGGASWTKTGSDGLWLSLFEKKGICCLPFESSNSGVDLEESWRIENHGELIKNCVVSAGELSCAGDLVCTQTGLEGKPIYAVNRALRLQLKMQITIDFKPQFSVEEIQNRLESAKNNSEGLKLLKLAKPAVHWLKEKLTKAEFLDAYALAHQIKGFRVPIAGFRPLEEVISVVGGIDESEICESGELKKWPTYFACGEMLNWDAPTGGYLIQGCVSSGAKVGNRIKQLLTDQYAVD